MKTDEPRVFTPNRIWILILIITITVCAASLMVLSGWGGAKSQNQSIEPQDQKPPKHSNSRHQKHKVYWSEMKGVFERFKENMSTVELLGKGTTNDNKAVLRGILKTEIIPSLEELRKKINSIYAPDSKLKKAHADFARAISSALTSCQFMKKFSQTEDPRKIKRYLDRVIKEIASSTKSAQSAARIFKNEMPDDWPQDFFRWYLE